ncbi:MAG: aminoacyl-tRNA hydrolase [Candidatus Alcyoniella australis]|nr:aminoacyl-tRNA hydrolase [Candidatus Alcyoniella australis]
MKIICGLGNPGEKYAGTRHNAGFLALNALAGKLGVEFSRVRFNARCAEAHHGKEKLILLKPRTYMNLSGRSAAAAVGFYNLDPSELFVIHDDLDLPTGAVRLKLGGGSGGHKGLNSIVGDLGADGFVRVRIGIGRPQGSIDPADYVLQRPGADQLELIETAAERAAEALLTTLDKGLNAAMNVYNRSQGGTVANDPETFDQGAQQ